MSVSKRVLWVICGVLSLTMASSAADNVVKKDIASFSAGQWAVNTHQSASAVITPGKELNAKVNFAGKGFSAVTLRPAAALRIPGECRRVSLSFCSPKMGFTMKFRDGWGREEVDGRRLEIGLGETQENEWKKQDFPIPGDWVMPLEFVGFVAHNWGRDREKIDMTFGVSDFRAETDLTNVDRETGKLKTWKAAGGDVKNVSVKESPAIPLLTASISTGELSNVFAGTEPRLLITARNWLPGQAQGRLEWKVTANDEKTVVVEGAKDVTIDALADLEEKLAIAKFGRYHVAAKLKITGGKEIAEKLILAKLPATHKLSEEEKMRSPYGMNIHSGKPNGDLRSYIPPFVKAGLVWFRDYSWSYGFTQRSKGEDNKFAGWPCHNVAAAQAQEFGIMLMPCMAGSIQPPDKKNGKITPSVASREWSQHLTQLFSTFPEIKFWELDNEYDLHPNTNWGEYSRMESQIGWKNYGNYHKKFAGILDVMYDGTVKAVENGRAGIHPEKVLDCVKSGAFANIAVINSHHYCGTDAPEVNVSNMNTASGGGAALTVVRTFFDMLRDSKRAGQSDGVKREHWLTEFGWDTLAGKVVTPYEQAVYLPRGWMVSMAAGTEKSFWFFDEDSANPGVFFDGCGLLGPAPAKEPKLALSSLAAMTHLMPTPEYIGSLNVGEGTHGYLFKQNDKYIAAVWNIANDNGPEVNIPGEAVYDFLGNKLPAGKHKLTRAPLYISGVALESSIFQQTAYEIDSRHIEAASDGDEVRPQIKIVNNRKTPLTCTLKTSVPAGWKDTTAAAAVTVAPGAEKVVEASFKVGDKAITGNHTVKILCQENGKELKAMPLIVQIVTPQLALTPLGNVPGEREVTATISNLTRRPISGKISCALPASWKLLTQDIKVSEIKPLNKGEVKFKVKWDNNIKDNETARVTFTPDKGGAIERPLIPGVLQMRQAENIKIDGNLSDWNDRLQIPAWTIGCNMGDPNAKIWMAWSDKGIYGAVQVNDSRVMNDDPRSFWIADCLEMFIDTQDSKNPRDFTPTDHQFWLVPTKDGKVFCGRWKRKDEIKENIYDIKEVQGVSKKTDKGYEMEFFIPAAVMNQYRPGKSIGLNLNLTVKGRYTDREVFWPEIKNWAIQNRPQYWGSVTLTK